MLATPKDYQNQLMLVGACTDNEETIKSAIASGANVNEAFKHKDQMTALHLASHLKHPRAVEILLAHGANPEARDRHLNTPLHLSARVGCYNSVSLLVNAKAPLDATNKPGFAALHYACSEDNESIISLLLEKKASHSLEAGNGLTPLHNACLHESYRAAELLLDARADIEARILFNGWNPLCYACHFGNRELVFMLLDRGASIDFKVLRRGDFIPKSIDFLDTFEDSTLKQDMIIRGFVWRPDNQSKAPISIRRVVETVTLIRNLMPECCISLLPNELLFEIFYFLRGVAS